MSARSPSVDTPPVPKSISLYQSMTNKYNSIVHSETARKVGSYILRAGAFIGKMPLYSLTNLSMGLATGIIAIIGSRAAVAVSVCILSTMALVLIIDQGRKVKNHYFPSTLVADTKPTSK